MKFSFLLYNEKRNGNTFIFLRYFVMHYTISYKKLLRCRIPQETFDIPNFPLIVYRGKYFKFKQSGNTAKHSVSLL